MIRRWAKAEAWVPHAYQLEAAKWLVGRRHAALFMDPGLGKTSVTLKALQTLRRVGKLEKALVIAPLRVAQLVWARVEGSEVERWADFKDLRVELLHGPAKATALARDADLYVINFDGLPWLIAENRLRELLRRGVNCLVVDELSKLKHTKSKRFKLLKPWLEKFTWRWGLTGSPAANGLLDLFGQLFVVDGGKALGRYITHYRNRFFLSTGYGGYTWVPMAGAQQQIEHAIRDVALSFRATDHLDLPDLVERDIIVELPSSARKIYDALETDFIAQVENHTITACNAAAASGKCRQAANGGLYTDDADQQRVRVLVLHNAKTDALQDLVDELQGEPLLVAFEFRHDLGRIRAALGDVPAIDGTTSQHKGSELVNAWNAGELTLLCGHPQSMAHGLNMQRCGHHLCWYSLTWDLELYEQFIRRVWRQGNDASRVIVHRLVAAQTIDEVVVKTLRRKHRCQDSLLTELSAYSRSVKR